jgi:hypothetical protein
MVFYRKRGQLFSDLGARNAVNLKPNNQELKICQQDGDLRLIEQEGNRVFAFSCYKEVNIVLPGIKT